VGASEMVRQWRHGLNQLLPGLHGHLLNALAAFSLAMALAGHCHSGRLAAVAPSPGARVGSRQRRWERLLSNRRLRPSEAMGALARSVLPSLGAGRARRRVVLTLDETPGGTGGRLRCMKLCAAYRKRVVPLAFECYPAYRPPVPMPRLLYRLLRRAARSLPGGVEVTLLADRGLSWPSLLDCCAALGWHYVLRLQRDTRVRVAGGVVKAAWELAGWRGARWFGAGVGVFKDAGWREANVAATWERGCREPWLLVTDLPATLARCRNYCKRAWCEQTHRDEKGHGFNWQLSRVRDPSHAARLVLVMALATLLCLSLGTHCIKRGLRKLLEPTRRRLLSVFQLGLRWLRDCLVNGRDCPCQLYLHPS
jgi:Transposase DDE domain